ncbi:hypothetical protein PIS_123 [Saccharomonospora phage PIS 136]|nr:hypothetical protein PIS_123 [Saccharomonospora phage PIS 136]
MMNDAPTAVLDRVPPLSETEQTMQMSPGFWQWPTVDPDDRERVIAEARAVMRYQEGPTLPVLRAVLEGLRRL